MLFSFLRKTILSSLFTPLTATSLILSGCFHPEERLEPQIQIHVQDTYLKSLPSSLTPLSPMEQKEEWANECKIGKGFAKELDLYQAMTAFKRAAFLLPSQETTRLLELNYMVCLSYYLGGKYQSVLNQFELSPLKTTTPLFKPYQDLLVMLYDSSLQLGKEEKKETLIKYMESYCPLVADKLLIIEALRTADFPFLLETQEDHPEIKTVLTGFFQHKKSSSKAQLLNAILPGSGYLYLNQKQSAITAFLLNTLFTWGSVYSFQHHNTALGLILAGFEAGWYFGGIHGVKDEVKLYNERVYEAYAIPMMNEYKYFPIFMLSYGF
ncbi:hypothetical protein [Rhabdochlamydiaceae symbiont of Dictyostelium giganteum]|uniref:hypothetical protein n=1 Tax=Rhabdochlamydiaceae symbiont of Dictyostelium giganteum TaxID=3342349 RepID=UPI003850D3E0